MTSNEVIKRLKADGWYEVNVVGSHHQFKHPMKGGRVTITHPWKDIPIGSVEYKNMKERYCFPAVLEKGDNEYGVYFPDLDGCVTGGATVEEAMKNADEALLLHLYGMEEDGLCIPEASDPASVAVEQGEFVLLVEVNYKLYKTMMNRKRKTCTLTVPAGLYAAAKRAASTCRRCFRMLCGIVWVWNKRYLKRKAKTP